MSLITLDKRLIEFKWTSIGQIKLEQAQMSVNESIWSYKRSNEPK